MDQAQAKTAVQPALISGSLFVLLAAFGFSAKAVLIKLAYAYPVDAVTLLALRMAFSLPFFLVLALVKRSPPGAARLSRRDWLAVAGIGLLGYYLASFLDFLGLEYISAGLERLILFLYPTLVVAFSALFFGRPFGKKEIAALALGYAGIALAFQPHAVESPEILLGAGLVFGSAVAYALYLIGSGACIAKLGATRFTAHGMTVACLACLLQYALTHPTAALLTQPRPVYALSLAMAIFATVLPSLLMSLGIRRIGASRSAQISSVGPVATLLLAYWFLGEQLSPQQMLGSALVLLGVLAVGR